MPGLYGAHSMLNLRIGKRVCWGQVAGQRSCSHREYHFPVRLNYLGATSHVSFEQFLLP